MPRDERRRQKSLHRKATPDASKVRVPLGLDGKPYFVSGPFDNVPKILAQLERAVGPGNFDFIAGIGAPPDFLGDAGE